MTPESAAAGQEEESLPACTVDPLSEEELEEELSDAATFSLAPLEESPFEEVLDSLLPFSAGGLGRP